MDLETHLLETLWLRGEGQGLTHGELREKCGAEWRRELARRSGQEGEEASLALIKTFVHQLWLDGRVVIEPPSGEGKAVRVWHPDTLGKGGAVVTSAAPAAPGERDGEAGGRIAAAYEQLAREGRSPYVFLSRLRDEASLPLEELHRHLRQEQAEGRAVLSTGDWSSASEEVRAAVLEAEGRQYIKVRLRGNGAEQSHGTEI